MRTAADKFEEFTPLDLIILSCLFSVHLLYNWHLTHSKAVDDVDLSFDDWHSSQLGHESHHV